jgi:predicted DNA-binding transcriptional regulator AlpA
LALHVLSKHEVEDIDRARKRDVLPLSLPPRGLPRVEAAAYVGVSPSLFDQMVADGRMPQPKRIDTRTVWDRRQLDEAFTALPDGDDCRNPWDGAAA